MNYYDNRNRIGYLCQRNGMGQYGHEREGALAPYYYDLNIRGNIGEITTEQVTSVAKKSGPLLLAWGVGFIAGYWIRGKRRTPVFHLKS